MPSKWKQAGKLGPEEQKERNAGDLRRDAGAQESVQPELQERQEEQENILTKQQDEEQEEEKSLPLPRLMERKKNIKHVLTFAIKHLVIEFALNLHKELIPERK